MVDAVVSLILHYLLYHQINSIPINHNKKGTTVLDVHANTFISKLAEVYKEKNLIKLPNYVNIVKCAYSNELAPSDPDWFYHKAAAISRQIYITKSKSLGVGSIKSRLGKKHRRGVNACVTSRAGGKIIRDIIGQLKANKYVENYASTEGNTLGLLITKAGKSALDKVAATIKK